MVGGDKKIDDGEEQLWSQYIQYEMIKYQN